MEKSKFLVFCMLLAFIITSVAFADTLKIESEGQAVNELQTQLKEKGYFKGDVTGYFDNETKAAVKRFQVQKGFIATGMVDENLGKLIAAGTSSSAKTETAVSKSAVSATSAAAAAGTMAAKAAATAPAAAKPATAAAKAASKAKDAKIEVLDWWKDARYVFKIGTVAKVIDVWSGKSFKIVRTYGGNHADCETLTKEDTEIMKAIWGGSWSWNRRPVVLEIGERRLAASMAGMPHAGLDELPADQTVSSRSGGYGRGTNLDKIKDNDMSGHFDVHFLNSRTHGTDKVDPQHQAAIKIAAKAKLTDE